MGHFGVVKTLDMMRQSYWFPNAETDITTICVAYLSFDVFERGFCQTNVEFEERLQSNPFFGSCDW